MKKNLPVRKPNRLINFDYSTEGAYFITICTHPRRKILSRVGAIHESPAIRLSKIGSIVEEQLLQLSSRFGIDVAKYVIMPNHIHLILVIDDLERAIRESPLQKRSIISKVIGYLKMNVSKEVHRNSPNLLIWQRSFHDHVIRDAKDYNEIADYIEANPLNWEADCFYDDGEEDF